MAPRKKTPAKKKTAKKAAKRGAEAPAAPRPALKGAEVRFELAVPDHGLEPILGAAYLMMDRAYARLSGDKKRRLVVELRTKDGSSAKALAEDFLAELASQRLRWAVAKNNLPVREYIAEQAVRLAQGHEPPPQEEAPSQDLTSEQREEIDRLIAEVEEEIKGMGAEKESRDPKNLSASWEEKHGEASKRR